MIWHCIKIWYCTVWYFITCLSQHTMDITHWINFRYYTMRSCATWTIFTKLGTYTKQPYGKIQCIKGDNCETVKINCGPILHELDITYNDCCYISSSVINFYRNYLLEECHEGLRCTFSLEVSHRYCKFLGKVSNQTKDYKRISNLKFET